MTARLLLPILIFSTVPGLTAHAAEPSLPPGDKEPLLRVEAGGFTSYVTALAFSADGKMLYAGGWDKEVRVWSLNDQGQFVPDRTPPYRVPIGPDRYGAIDALALSEGGIWLAAAGHGVFRNTAGFREPGFVVPSFGATTAQMRRDIGTIYLFNTTDRSVRLLQGHEGGVVALTFAAAQPGKPLLLLSAARERNLKTNQFRTAVRLWNVERGESVAELSLLPDVDVRPALAVWHTGDPANPVQAAFALSDGVFRIWDVQRKGNNLREIDVAKYNRTVVHLPEPAPPQPARILTASYGEQKANLTLWEVPGAGRPKVRAEPARPHQPDSFPQALSLLSSKSNSKPDLAATILQVPEQGERGDRSQYRLQLFDLDPAHFGTVRAEKILWQGRIAQPVLATSLNGKNLAVAGNEAHEILIYEIASLLRKDKTPPQKLGSSGVTFRHVSFASNGKDLALLLNVATRKRIGEGPPAAARGDLVFDVAKRRLTADATDWKTSAPSLRRWQVRHTDEGKHRSVAVYRDGQLYRRINLPAGQEFSDYALLPPHGTIQVPLLALATHDHGLPQLDFYNASSGELVRRFTGHVERLFGLAFSGDGRLLASAAEDQTVCIWSLTDIDQVLGQRGQLPGLNVKVGQQKGTLDVAEVQDESPANGKLRKGDLLAGLVVQGKLQPLASPLAFYEAIFRLKPGQKATLRRGDPQGNDDIILSVGQGADERKPLLTLFVIRDAKSDKVEDGEWIGWNPLGPYECSSPRAERFLGWHFNTGDVKTPTRFVLADAHHKDYYREGILDTLIRQGKLDRVEGPKLSPPSLVMVVEETGQCRPPEEQGPLAVSHSRVTLKLEIRDRPLHTLKAVTWKLDDGPEKQLDLEKADAQPFAVPLELQRGDHRVVVTAWTRDMPPESTQKQVTLRYQPPRPRVQLEAKTRQLFVKQEEAAFDFKALVYPGLADEEVRVTVHHWHDQKDRILDSQTLQIDPKQPLAINRRVQLLPGSNVLEVIAVNRNAPRDLESAEKDDQKLEVVYIQKARPPIISMSGVLPLTAPLTLPSPPAVGGEGRVRGGKVLKVERFQTVVVHAPKVRVLGAIEASEDLLQAEWDQGKTTRSVSLTGFEPNKAKSFPVKEEFNLRPGPQTFRFQARTATSDVREQELTVDYRPLLPTVTFREPRSGEILYGEKPTTVVGVRGRVVLPEDRHPYRTVLVLNEKEVTEPPTIDERAGTWTAAVAVAPGENRIRIRLSNAWGMVADSEETLVRYLRPPQILGLKPLQAAGKPVLNLEARVRSPLPLLPESVKVEVNGQEARLAHIEIGKAVDGVQVVRLEEVPLEAGMKENQVRLWVSNTEAQCREPGSIPIETARVLPPPLIEFLDPRQDLVVSRPELTVRFQIRSVSPITKAQLLLEGHAPLPVETTQVARNAEGEFELTADQNLELTRGLNHLSLEAINASGRRLTPPLVVNYVPPPLQVVIDRLEPIRPKGKPLAPEKRPHGRIVFSEAAAHGRVLLQGRILWADDKTARAQQDLRIRAIVNGFQQAPGHLKPSASNHPLETPFEVPLLLSWEKANHVSLVVHGQDATDPTEFVVDCRQPVKGQRLHLLILSPSGKDAEEFKEQVLQAVRCSPNGRPLKTPAFEQVEPYGPLVGSRVRPGYINDQLFNIKEAITLAQEGAPMNDVVMIYYQGGESVDDRGNRFQSYTGQGVAKQFGIPCDMLVEFLADTAGAHVLLLDVDRDPPAGNRPLLKLRDKILHWQDDYPAAQAHIGVLRNAWLGKSNAPMQARLITVMGEAMPRAARLSQVISFIRDTLAKFTSSELLVYMYVPNDLQVLLVGGGG